MHILACVFVCMYIDVCVCGNVFVCVQFVCVFAYVSMCVCVCLHKHVCVYAWMHVCTYAFLGSDVIRCSQWPNGPHVSLISACDSALSDDTTLQ